MVKASVSGSLCWIPGQHSGGFCLKGSPESLHFPVTPQTQAAHLKFNSAVLRSMESPARISPKVKTCCKNVSWLLFLLWSLEGWMRRGGKKNQKKKLNERKQERRPVPHYQGKRWAKIKSFRLFFTPYAKVKPTHWSGISKTDSSDCSKGVLIHFTVPGNVYIPEHNLFSDIPVKWKQWGCVLYIMQWGQENKHRYYLYPAPRTTHRPGEEYFVKMLVEIGFWQMTLNLIWYWQAGRKGKKRWRNWKGDWEKNCEG